MKGIFLLLGSNQGDSSRILEQAVKDISRNVGAIVRSSSVYRTSAWGIENQPDYLNQVLEVDSDLTPGVILERILLIEKSLGRIRDVKWSSRIIDIDLLYFDSAIVDEPNLTIPHPEIQNRRFTLVPLCEIAPGFMHPKLGKTQIELLNDTSDKLEVTLL